MAVHQAEGFTLVELIVVVGISILLSSFLIVYSGDSRRRVSLYVEEANVAQTILRARALSLATYGETSSPCGYGVTINYIANTDGIYEYESFRYEKTMNPTNPCAVPITNIFSFRKTVESIHELSREVKFERVPPSSPPFCNSVTNILYVPPDPVVVIEKLGGASCSSAPNEIMLTTSDDAAATTISITKSGQVDF